VYVPSAGNVLREREQHIQLLQQELRQKENWLEETTRELKKLSEENLAEQKRAQAAVNKLEAELQEKIEWAEQVKAELAATQGELTKCVELLTRAEATVVERSAWAKRLDRELNAIYMSKGYRISRRLGLSPSPPAPAGAAQNSGQDGGNS
jgi:septal ring factor EnvC (AmiA/AmiB activator)